MRKKSKNSNLQAAKRVQNDEFYTQLTDIERELYRYKKYFYGQHVYLNCDDPENSEFWRFFYLKFDDWQLRQLTATHFDKDKPTYRLDIYAAGREPGNVRPEEVIRTDMEGNGDFRSSECVDILQACDIVVTNPPFSLAREYVAQLMEHQKRFLIIGNKNWITYKEIFPYIKDNRLWLGYNAGKGTMHFLQPDGSTRSVASYWYTNLPTSKRKEPFPFRRSLKMDAGLYQKYDNYDAINVDKVVDIPEDYTGVMGVPITFLERYNPAQFEILGTDYAVKLGQLSCLVVANWTGKLDRGYINGKRLYSRLLIRNKQQQ